MLRRLTSVALTIKSLKIIFFTIVNHIAFLD